MVTPVISLDKSQNGYLSITDITTYSAGQRDLTGIMQFWSNDAFATDVNLDQSNADIWTVPAVAQDTYSIYSLYCYTWDVLNDIDFAKYGIAFYNGYFYLKTTAGTKNPFDGDENPNMDTTNWSPLVVGQPLTVDALVYAALTAADIYALSVLSTQQTGPTAIQTTAITYIDQDAFTLTKPSCLNWLVTINVNCTIARVRLINYDQTVLVDNLIVVGNTIPIDLSTYGDGSYTVEIAYVLPSNNNNINIPTYWLIVTIPILEVCNANACYTKLFKYVLCKCDDPCDDCEDLTAKRHDLQVIRELVTSINNMVSLERSQFIGLYPISTSQTDLLADIGQMIDKLKIVTDRCGLCGKRDTLNMNCQ